MQSVAALAILVLVGASIVVAVRLLLLHRRTGGLPELLLGGMLLLSVGVGYPLRIAAQQAPDQGFAVPFTIASEIAIGVGFSLFFVFTWCVFRPEATWARIFTAAGVITLLGRGLHGSLQVHSRGVIDAADASLNDAVVQMGPVVVAYLWTAWESLRYHGAMRRRVRLGLADPTVSNRFLLWGLMGLTATSGVLLNFVAVALHVDVFHSAWVLLCSSVTGLGQTLFLVLALVPPRAYLAWVRARAAASAA